MIPITPLNGKARERFHIAIRPGASAVHCGADESGPVAIALDPKYVPPDRRTCLECLEAHALAIAPVQRYRRHAS